MGAPSFSRRGGGGGGRGEGGAEGRGGAPIIGQWRQSNKKSDTADWGGVGGGGWKEGLQYMSRGVT